MLSRPNKLFLALLLLLVVGAPRALAAGDEQPPAWLQQAAAASVPSYDKKVSAVVLHDQSTVTVGEDGRVRSVTTYAVRIITREGNDYAEARIPYLTGTEKVKELRAWMIYPGGRVKRYGKDETADVAQVANDVYNEARAKVILGDRDAEPGAVFGYQVATEERYDFSQLHWFFQGHMPVLSSRVSLTLPAGWRASSVTFNHPNIEPAVAGTTYTWELRNLPYIEDEPSSPVITNIAPHVAIAYSPAAGAAAPGARAFNNWADISRWYTELSDPQSALDDTIATKVRELTANSKTELEKIQAVGRYVQSLQYISVQIGVGRYRPHSAAEVFSKSYGDCKDKANLMRTMLKALRIPSHFVLIFSGDPTFVREEWPSPSQFNHAIIAIKVSDETQAATVVQHPTLGRLLIFDPTDSHTPVGDLPDHEQGSLALVAAGDAGALLRMPVTPPEANRLERQAEVVLNSDGMIQASVKERSVGQAAVSERRIFRTLARPDYQKAVEYWITRGASAARVTRVEPSEAGGDGRFALDVDFVAPNYGQVMQERRIVFKPAIVSRREHLFLTAEKRKHPVILESHAYSETVRVKLPAGFEVDEMPEPLKLDTTFGSYAASYEVKDGQLLFTRTFTQRAATIPAEQYKTVRDFYSRISATEQAPVVLAKK